LEPDLVALTSTPSMAASSVELIWPVSAAAGACAETEPGNENAAARTKPATVGSG